MKNILILLIFISSVCNGQIKDFFKYSTFYTSMSMNTSFTERENYVAIQTTLLLGMLMAGSIFLIILLYGIAVKNLLIKIFGLDI